MRSEQRIQQPREVFKVSEWKWGIDEGSPWWRRFYFKYVFLRLLDFSFGVMKVPTPKGVEIKSDDKGKITRRYFWFEDIAILDDEDKADAACLTEHAGYKRMLYGQVAPSESAQYSGTVFPRKKNPRKWSQPTLSLVIKDRKQEERQQQTLAEYIAQLHRVLDQ